MAVIPIPNRAAVHGLTRGFEVHGVADSAVTVVATDDELARLRTLGYSPRVTLDDYQAWVDSVLLAYRTYDQVCSTMTALADSYRLICRLETLGLSVQNRVILAMRVTDNPLVEEAEPEFRILGPHHGDEKIAGEIALSFLRYVLASYDTCTAVRNMVDSTELWFIPVVNVDGHHGNRRSNANGVDLNRDYGYRWSGMGGSQSPFSQPETRLIRQHAIDNNIAIEFEYHSIASYVNYLWDNHPADPPDSTFISALAQEYADSTYGSRTTQLAPVNGYEWYQVDGSCQDASFGLFGNIAFTIETEQPSQQTKIDSICVANRRALLGLIGACRLGVKGIVRDSLTGSPLFARISVDSPLRWDCYADPALGDFHKPLPAGAYTLTAHAQGFLPKTIADVVVPAGGSATVDFDLAPDPMEEVYADEMVWLVRSDPNEIMPTTSIFALGAPDGSSFSLGRFGDVCLSAGRGRAITNVSGNDITVFDGDSVADGYWLYAGNDWAGPWTGLGHANGTQSFDIGSAGLDSARYLRIVCDSTGSSSDPKAGLDLDAVAYRSPLGGVGSPSAFRVEPSASLALFPNPASGVLHVLAPLARSRLEIIDIAGRMVKCYPFGGGLFPLNRSSGTAVSASRYRIDLEGAGLTPGVYLVRLESATGTTQQKLVVARF